MDPLTELPPMGLTREEHLTLRIAELLLQLGFVQTAARAVLAGARLATKAQCLVLKQDLDELLRRLDDARGVVEKRS